jgi:hypothetical protein
MQSPVAPLIWACSEACVACHHEPKHNAVVGASVTGREDELESVATEGVTAPEQQQQDLHVA